MAQLAVIGTIASLASGAAKAVGAIVDGRNTASSSIAQGEAAHTAGEFEAAQLERKATEERVQGQREASDKDMEARYQMSRFRALAAASGAGGNNIYDIVSDMAERAEHIRGGVMGGAENRARGFEDQAKAARYNAAVARATGQMTAKAATSKSWLEAAGAGFGAIGDATGSKSLKLALSSTDDDEDEYDAPNNSSIATARYG